MIKSEKIYSVQQYLEAVVGVCFLVRGDNDINFTQNILDSYGFEYQNHPMSEISHIVNNNLNVVLVDCMVVNEKTNNFEHKYRWFEVPENFTEDEE